MSLPFEFELLQCLLKKFMATRNGLGNKTGGKTIRENGKSEAKLLEFSSP